MIVDYLEDHLAKNVAQEWTFEKKKGGGETDVVVAAGRKRRLSNNDSNNDSSDDDDSDEEEEKDDGEIIRNSMERAFLLTDIQSRMAGLTTSGATVVCTIIVPNFDNDGNCTDIEIHAANAGDARAVLSSANARSASAKNTFNNDETTSNNAVRITQDHKSTDASEIERIKAAGGTMIRNRVMGILAVARSLGDHGLKEFVIAKPFLSSTVVKIADFDRDDDNMMGGSDYHGNSNVQSVTSISSNNTNSKSSISNPPYTNGEFLIVACDGLWDVIEDDEAVDAVHAHVAKNGMASRTDVASVLVDEALERGSTDNITVVVYWL